MEWKLSAEQLAYQEALRGWLADVATSETVRDWLDRADPSGFEKRLRMDAMSGVGVAESRGGQGGGVVELALTAEELGRACAPAATWLTTVLALPALPDECAAEAIAGSAVSLLAPADQMPTEAPALGLDSSGAVTGEVPRVLGGDRTARYVVVAESEAGRSLRLVDASAHGVTRGARQLLDRSRSVADVRLAGTPSRPLPAASTEQVRVVLDQVTDLTGVLLAADALGTMERMLDLAVGYSVQRKQFGVLIGSFQAVKHAAASILVDVEAGRSGVYYAAASVESGHLEHAQHAAAMKAQVTSAASRAADTALTIHGAIGYTWEHDLHLFYKRARLDAELFGAPGVWNERIAERLALV
ncbi:MAG: acyl-CoA dehydrogenase family protein [Acidimicrobiales bacterium]